MAPEEKKVHGEDDVLSASEAINKVVKVRGTFTPRESPLKDYIVSFKHELIKIAVQKLAKLS